MSLGSYFNGYYEILFIGFLGMIFG